MKMIKGDITGPLCTRWKQCTVLQHVSNACVPNNVHIHNLFIPHIPAIVCTRAMTFLDCILTSGLNLYCNTLNTNSCYGNSVCVCVWVRVKQYLL